MPAAFLLVVFVPFAALRISSNIQNTRIHSELRCLINTIRNKYFFKYIYIFFLYQFHHRMTYVWTEFHFILERSTNWIWRYDAIIIIITYKLLRSAARIPFFFIRIRSIQTILAQFSKEYDWIRFFSDSALRMHRIRFPFWVFYFSSIFWIEINFRSIPTLWFIYINSMPLSLFFSLGLPIYVSIFLSVSEWIHLTWVDQCCIVNHKKEPDDFSRHCLVPVNYSGARKT